MKKILTLIYIYLIINISGNPSFPGTYMQQTIAFFSVALCSFILVQVVFNKNRVSVYKVLYLLFFISSMFFTYFVNENFRFNTPIALTLTFVAVMLFSGIIPEKEFRDSFIYLVVFLAFMSLIMYTLGVVSPELIYIFPSKFVPDVNNRYYYFAVFHTYISFYDNSFLLFRNNGLFWEPGAYQSILNVALYFLLFTKVNISPKWKKIAIAILVVTILTTGSTTGYILLIMILLFFVLSSKSGLRNMFMIIMLLIISSILVTILNVDIVSSILKLGNLNDVLRRTYIINDLNTLFYQGSFHFFGLTFEKFLQITNGSANSITSTYASLGVLFTSILLLLYIKYCSLFQNTFLFFIILMIIFSTEGFLLKPIYLMFAFYAIDLKWRKKNVRNINYTP